MKILPELCGVVLTVLALIYLPGCSPAAVQRVQAVAAGLATACETVLAADPQTVEAARQAGVPAPEYIQRTCVVVQVVAPMMQQAVQAPVCPVPPVVPRLSGVAGAPPMDPVSSTAGAPAAPP